MFFAPVACCFVRIGFFDGFQSVRAMISRITSEDPP
jgi:hypothetical protein